MRVLSNARAAITGLFLMLTNPTTVIAALFILFRLFGAAVISTLVPLSVRYAALPSSVEAMVPLDLVFDTCLDQLHGVCSFPTATIDLQMMPLFSSGVHYSMAVDIRFPDPEQAKRLGLFQNVIRITDKNSNIVKEFHKSTFFREPSFLRKVFRLCFFPVYLLGIFDDATLFSLHMAHDYYENPSTPSEKLIFQLQNRFAQVESAELRVAASFGIIRHVLYHYPLITSALLWLSSFSTLSTLILITAGFSAGHSEKKASISDSKNRVILERSSTDEYSLVATPPPSPSSTLSSYEHVDRPESQHRAEDEFIPENVNEIPECVPLFKFTEIEETGEHRDSSGSEESATESNVETTQNASELRRRK